MHHRFRSTFLSGSGLLLALSAVNGANADVYQSSSGFSSPTQLLTFDEVVLYYRQTKFPICRGEVPSPKTSSLVPRFGQGDPAPTSRFWRAVSIPVQTPLTNQYAAYGVTFSGAIYDPYTPPDNGPNISGNVFANFTPNVPVSGSLLISFASPVEAAAMAFVSQPGTTTITSYLGTTQVETYGFSTNLTSTNNYIGFTNSDFDSLKITVSSSDASFIADNLQFTGAGVPETSTIVMGLLGLSLPGAGFLLRKRRGQVV